MALSDTDLLDPLPTLGTRVDAFEWWLLDSDLSRLETFHPSLAGHPTISASTDRSTMRTLSGVEIPEIAHLTIDPLRMRIMPRMVLENGSSYDLGVFLFGEHQRFISTRAQRWTPELQDQGFALDQPTERPTSYSTGKDIKEAISEIVTGAGITQMRLDTGGMLIGEPTSWPPGTSRYEILKTLAGMMGCMNPFFAADGFFTCRQAPNVETVTPDARYSVGGPRFMVADTITETDDTYQAPNRYIVRGQGSDTSIVGVFDIPPTAPHSIANRGYVVAENVDMPGVESADAAEQAAIAAFLTDSRSWQKVTFDSLLDPRLDLYSFIEYTNAEGAVNLYLEVGFSQALVPGGRHSHELSRLWRS